MWKTAWRCQGCHVSWDASYSVLATFTFKWTGNKFSITKNNNEKVISGKSKIAGRLQWVGNKFSIMKNDNERVKSEKSYNPSGGCGRSIQWRYMAPVDVLPEIKKALEVGTCSVMNKYPPPSLSGTSSFLDEGIC